MAKKAAWPPSDATLQDWLDQTEHETRYRIADIADLIGSSAVTVRKMALRDDLPLNAEPTAYDEHGRYWGFAKVRDLLRYIARTSRLPDAFDEPMLTIEQVAVHLGYADAGSAKHAVYAGRVPKPAIPSKGRLRALWREADIEAELEEREESVE